MNHSQQIRLATRLERYAPCILAVNWALGCIESILYSPERIDPRFLASLTALCHRQGIELIAD